MSDRKLTIAVSKDGGHNFQYTRELHLGEVGEYRPRPPLRRFGHARDFRIRLRVTSPVCVDILGGTVKYEVGDA